MTYREQLVKRKPDADRQDRVEPDRAEKVEPADAPTQAELAELDVTLDLKSDQRQQLAQQQQHQDTQAVQDLREDIGIPDDLATVRAKRFTMATYVLTRERHRFAYDNARQTTFSKLLSTITRSQHRRDAKLEGLESRKSINHNDTEKIEKFIQDIEAAYGMLPEFSERRVSDIALQYDEEASLVENRVALENFADNVTYTIQQSNADDFLKTFLSEQVNGLTSSLGNGNDFRSHAAIKNSMEKMRQQLRHIDAEGLLPDQLLTDPQLAEKQPQRVTVARVYEMNDRILELQKQYSKDYFIVNDGDVELFAQLDETLAQLENERQTHLPDNTQLQALIIELHADVAAIRAKQEVGSDTGRPDVATQVESEHVRFEYSGKNQLDKQPKNHKGEILPLNEYGEDYVVIDVEYNLAVVADGTGSAANSAEASKRVSEALAQLYKEIPNDSTVDEIVEYLNTHLSVLADALRDMKQSGATTVLGSRYIPELGVAIIVDIGDSEAYHVRDGVVTRIEPAIGDTTNTALQLRVEKMQTGTSQIADDRTELDRQQRPLVKVVQVQPGDAIVLQSDGPRNNTATKKDAEVTKLVQLAVAGKLDQYPLARADDEVIAVQHIK